MLHPSPCSTLSQKVQKAGGPSSHAFRAPGLQLQIPALGGRGRAPSGEAPRRPQQPVTPSLWSLPGHPVRALLAQRRWSSLCRQTQVRMGPGGLCAHPLAFLSRPGGSSPLLATWSHQEVAAIRCSPSRRPCPCLLLLPTQHPQHTPSSSKEGQEASTRLSCLENRGSNCAASKHPARDQLRDWAGSLGFLICAMGVKTSPTSRDDERISTHALGPKHPSRKVFSKITTSIILGVGARCKIERLSACSP